MSVMRKSARANIRTRETNLNHYIPHRQYAYHKTAREKMEKIRVSGKNKTHKVLMYAISTCAWCKMTKQFLKDNDVEYEYVDVDLASDEDHERIRKEITRLRAPPSYPTVIVDEKTVVSGFRKDKLKEALDI